jgi:flagellar hook-associated protein 1 FlgK
MSFDGLRIALSSLQAQRRALEVTGQNVSNVATEGYSRQRVIQVADAGAVVPALFSRSSGVGGGVLSGNVERARDQFIEARANQEHAVDANLTQIQGTLDRVELAFGEPGDNGLGAQLADFLAGFDDVANKPDDSAARSQLVERAQTLTASFSEIDGTFQAIRANAIEELQSSTVDINATASRIADLNQRIQVAVTSGLSPNDLMDQRDLAASKLASSIGATIRPMSNGTVDIYVGGTALVRGSQANSLQVNVGATPPNTVSVVWTKDGQPASVGGESGARLTTANDIVPRYRAEITAVVTKLHDEVNALHTTGFGLDGVSGRDFFGFDANGNLMVDPAIAADPTKVGASGSAAATKDGSIARRIAALTGTESDYRGLVVRLGVESQTATRRVEIQAGITDQVDTAREASSGVDMDEEMTNMLMFQHAYDAAARLMSTIDANLDTLINRTGAGR